jgi:hypothetical protein
MSDTWKDLQWHKDYLAALQELDGCPGRMLPAPPERRLLGVLDAEDAAFEEVPKRPVYQPILQEPFNVSDEKRVLGTIDPQDFDPVGYRQAILARTTTRRTATPGVRQVLFLGQGIGEVAKSPWQPFLWIASTNRRQPFSSLADAAVEVARSFIEGGAV